MASSRRYGMQEVTMVTTSNASDWRCTIAESQSPIKWYALGNTYWGDTPAIDFIGNTGSETVTVKSSRGLTLLNCYVIQLTKLDVSKNVSLTKLYCSGNQLTELDGSGNVSLTKFWCDNNKLTKLNVSKNVSLTELYCHYNQLTKLDVSKNVSLSFLHCYNNPNLTIYVNATQLANIPSNWQKDATATYVLKQ
ncbi:leucine-rich repeat domain-containing protein [Tenacibaculum finnmarkense]|nr:leucine-rich repeat domain-containing protein [Tenacibaculum finnmarkense]MCD8411066.1 leucine-rich repeat domain-containing protein [Tenacibaculum finnmarkense genomovar ulcerans]